MIKFALRFKKSQELVRCTSRANDGDCCVSIAYQLATHGQLWLANSRAHAESVAKSDTEWYNQDYDTPGNDYVGQLEVVELEITIK